MGSTYTIECLSPSRNIFGLSIASDKVVLDHFGPYIWLGLARPIKIGLHGVSKVMALTRTVVEGPSF